MLTHHRGHHPALADFAQDLFGRLPRVDQRRWAQAYLQALLVTPGKKTVRRLAASVSDSPTASQAMHQFVNASPWDWHRVREDLMWWVERAARPRAWAIVPTVLPKRGVHSCGVHRRFDQETGRTVNCQLALGAFLSTDAGTLPVNWRLHLPRVWVTDPGMRRRARIPDTVEARSPVGDALDLIDARAVHGPHRTLPVTADLAGHGDPFELIAGLEARGVDFAVAVPAATPVFSAGRPARGERPAARTALPAVRTRLRASAPGGEAETTAWLRLPDKGSVTSRPYRMFVAPHTGQLWATNLLHSPAAELHRLTATCSGAPDVVRALAADFGLHDFEGRSFPGWHHHLTLVSAAYAYSLLTEGADAGRGDAALETV